MIKQLLMEENSSAAEELQRLNLDYNRYSFFPSAVGLNNNRDPHWFAPHYSLNYCHYAP